MDLVSILIGLAGIIVAVALAVWVKNKLSSNSSHIEINQKSGAFSKGEQNVTVENNQEAKND